jgi:hypothetical protein
MGYFYPSLRDLQGLPHLLPPGDLIDEGLLSLFEQPEEALQGHWTADALRGLHDRARRRDWRLELTLYLKADRFVKALELDGSRLRNPGIRRPCGRCSSPGHSWPRTDFGHSPGTQESIPGVEVF